MRSVRLFVLVALLGVSLVGIAAAANRNFRTHLTGDAEVPVRVTGAQGQAIFQLSEEGTALDYKLNVANIENVFAAHIHMAAKGASGPIVAWLYGPVPLGSGPINGRIADGTITAEDLVGPLAGQPLSALVAAIDSGNAYVNVHTNDGIAPANTGPGDFPGGEIRGQIHGHE